MTWLAENWREVAICWAAIAVAIGWPLGCAIARVQREIDAEEAEERLFHGDRY